MARALADGPLTLSALVDKAGVAQGTASRWLAKLGPSAPDKERCFRRGVEGYDLTERGRERFLAGD